MSLSSFIFIVRRTSLLNDAIFQDSVSDLSSNRVRTNPLCESRTSQLPAR
jgi:hypothetical protein